MVSEQKKKYMRAYNQRPEVKARKAAYMRRIRAEKDKQATRRLVIFLARLGYDDWAEELAIERAPEMLAVARTRAKK